MTPHVITSTDINRAVGYELRKVRDGEGWIRNTICARMSEPIKTASLGLYENGQRTCFIPRFVDVCQALRVNPSTIMAYAMQRCGVESRPDQFYVDIEAMACDMSVPERLRGWAGRRHAVAQKAIIQLGRHVVAELAIAVDIPFSNVEKMLNKFVPPTAPIYIVMDHVE